MIFHLLDTNLFRTLTSTPGGDAIARLNACLEQHQDLKNQMKTAIKMTPFGLLEAISFIPPKIPDPVRSRQLRMNSSGEIANFLLNYFSAALDAEQFLSAEGMQELAERQRAYTVPESMELFDICVTHPVTSPNFDQSVRKCLAFDHLFKFQFDNELRAKMHHLLLVMSLNVSPMISHGGRFRLVRRLWEQGYSSIVRANPQATDVLSRINKLMSLKNKQDYFDCDIVTFLCDGYWYEDAGNQVVAFTQDAAQTVVDRISVYKSTLKAALAICDPEARQAISKHVGTPIQGVLVPCEADGSFDSPISVSGIPAVM